MHGRIASAARGLQSYAELFVIRRDPAGSNPFGLIAKEVTVHSHFAVHHPFHPRTEQRAQEFDHNKLHIAVKAPKKLSRSGFVRKRTIRRCRAMLFEALKEKGYNFDGTRREEDTTPAVKGCYMVMLKKEAEVISAPIDAFLQCCRSAVNYIVVSQAERKTKPRR